MKLKSLLTIVAFLFITNSLLAQTKSYMASAGEIIFSYGEVDAHGQNIDPILRFSPVFNVQQRIHFDFSKSFGIYTGLAVRNVGLISHIDYTYTDVSGNHFAKTAIVKERSYSLGLPLALKIGKVSDGTYFAAGAEAEMMFAYKRKIIEGGVKSKINEWFGDQVNLFNPSVFAELRSGKGPYIRFKYYLMDFLDYKGLLLIDQTYIPDYGPESPLFYVSIGTETFRSRMKEDNKGASTDKKSAYFRTPRNNKSEGASASITE